MALAREIRLPMHRQEIEASGKPQALCCQAPAIIQRIKTIFHVSRKVSTCKNHTPIPCITAKRRKEPIVEVPFDTTELLQEVTSRPLESSKSAETVLYLAYGSNLSAETFQGARGIKPVSQVNVAVPELVMTFDLPGIPYKEPCFANTAYRSQKDLTIPSPTPTEPEKTSLLPATSKDRLNPPYHKDRWHKPMVGVVYEVTKADYAHIIATEGGGSSYQDILVVCYSLPLNADTVPETPDGVPFKAHTLFSPTVARSRPDPSYAQPSARYLKLITDGADEHELPQEYKHYLHNIRPYTITSDKQRLGQFIFLSIWAPIVAFLFMTARLFAGRDGRYPPWLQEFALAVFKAVWASYDGFFKEMFGDGERTVGKHADADADEEEEELVSETFRDRSVVGTAGYGTLVNRDLEKAPQLV